MQANRLQRVNSEIKKALASILAEDIRDPRLSTMISIVDVNTTNDLSHCTILVSIYDKDKNVVNESFRTLLRSAGFIRKLLSQRVDLRITPELHFKLDEGFENSEKMNKLIESLNIPKEEESAE
ncbi:MAG: 30S ribosome-binding factor RbfA [Clostridia bacterium]|nr:30S ribosome-binding factor RbfA [Clostridia bacterium]